MEYFGWNLFLSNLLSLISVSGKLYMKYDTSLDHKEKILGGERVDIKNVSHLVSFSMFGVHLCGGSIISPSHILTAAHCVDILKKNPAHLEVRSGSSTRNLGGVVSEVSQIIVHENFDYLNTGTDDIAIVVLKEPLKYNNNTREIPLITRALMTGEEVYISGWGLTSSDLKDVSETPRTLRLHVASKYLCKQFYPSKNGECAMTQNAEGACFGDSGGSLTIKGYLAGVASAIALNNCGTPDEPMLFMSTWIFKDWIKQKIGIK